MRRDLWFLAGVVALSLSIGLVAGAVGLCLVAGLAAYVYWRERGLAQLLKWLRSRKEDDAPQFSGLLGDICREITYLRGRHRNREDKLSLFLKRFKEATAALPDAVVILDQENRIEWANARAEDYLGIRWPQDARQRIANLIRYPELLAYLRSTRDATELKELSLSSPEDSGLKLDIRVLPYGDNLRLMVARDITRMQQVDQMRKDFIANASHELRTPLTVIAGYLEALEDDAALPDELRPKVKQMRAQAKRMQALIEDLLMLSALETEDKTRRDEVVAVPDLLSAIYKEAKTLSGGRNHVFSLEADPGLHIQGDPHELYSAFFNIVQNAVQYTPARGVIRIAWYADEEGAHLMVSDTGEGIAPEHIPRLTERFYRVDKGRSRDSGGTGLGLAIVKHVLTRHGAKLHIESALGKGSTFRCDFPPRLIVRAGARSDSGAIA